MPGFITHYLWGREAWKELPSGHYKSNLKHNRGAYAIGLQGPDIFFYFLPSYLLPRKNLGALAHTKATGVFFKALLEQAQHFPTKKEREIAAAYISGFLGHYTLDTICHPYIYAMSHYKGKANDYFSRHAYLEMDIDAALLDMKLHLRPRQFYHENTIVLTKLQKRVIATMLHAAYHRAFPKLHVTRTAMYLGLYSMPLTMRVLHDNTGQKKAAMRFAEKHFLGYPLFSPLILSDSLFFRTDPFNMRHARWANPWDSSLVSHETFFDLYEKAQVLYLKRLTRLSFLLDGGELSAKEKDRLKREILADYGNNSFHSGLDVSIPS